MTSKNLRWFRKAWGSLGYTIQLRKSGHYQVRSPQGRYVTTISATPSDPSAGRNAKAAIRRFHRRNGVTA